jgi:hypothetical protein
MSHVYSVSEFYFKVENSIWRGLARSILCVPGHPCAPLPPSHLYLHARFVVNTLFKNSRVYTFLHVTFYVCERMQTFSCMSKCLCNSFSLYVYTYMYVCTHTHMHTHTPAELDCEILKRKSGGVRARARLNAPWNLQRYIWSDFNDKGLISVWITTSVQIFSRYSS